MSRDTDRKLVKRKKSSTGNIGKATRDQGIDQPANFKRSKNGLASKSHCRSGNCNSLDRNRGREYGAEVEKIQPLLIHHQL